MSPGDSLPPLALAAGIDQDFAIFSSSKGEHKGKVEGVRPGFECLLVFISQFTFGNLLNFLSFRFLKLE